MVIESATKYLNNLKKIKIDEINNDFSSDVFLCDEKGEYQYLDDDVLNYVLDGKNTNMKDLLRMVHINDALTCYYTETHVLMPRVYIQNELSETPSHMNVQSVMFHVLGEDTLNFLKQEVKTLRFDKTNYDKPWVGRKFGIDDLHVGDAIYLMNRRVGGWDGSIERPVIELLTAGGHLPNIWNEKKNCFETLDQKELIKKEIKEELKINLDDSKLKLIGGFHNKYSNALVILYGIMLGSDEFINAWNNSKNNYEENTDGMYAGVFDDVIDLYYENPSYFAGGIEAQKTNFPSYPEIIDKIHELLNKKN